MGLSSEGPISLQPIVSSENLGLQKENDVFRGWWHQIVFILHQTLYSLIDGICIVDTCSNTRIMLNFNSYRYYSMIFIQCYYKISIFRVAKNVV